MTCDPKLRTGQPPVRSLTGQRAVRMRTGQPPVLVRSCVVQRRRLMLVVNGIPLVVNGVLLFVPVI